MSLEKSNEILPKSVTTTGKETFHLKLNNHEVPLGFASGILTLIIGTTHHISATMERVSTFI